MSQNDESLGVKCTGGTIDLEGAYSFFIELQILKKDIHVFECYLEFETLEHAEVRAISCMAAMPLIVRECLRTDNMKLFDTFCEEWSLFKVEWDDKGEERPSQNVSSAIKEVQHVLLTDEIPPDRTLH